MAELADSRGFYLAELRRLYHEFRQPYLTWAVAYGHELPTTLLNYRRALLSWYEARKDAARPYTGDDYFYVQSVADVYFGGRQQEVAAIMSGRPDGGAVAGGKLETGTANPLDHLPRPIRLDERQQLMLRQFHELGRTCRNLLLLSDYHGLIDARIGEVLELGTAVEEVATRRRKCLLMARERWQASGIMDPLYIPSPVDEELIDRYYANQLAAGERWEIEARRTTDTVLRDAMQLREDWNEVLTVAGRQDVMQLLEREEADYAPAPEPEPLAPAAAPEVVLTKRRRRGVWSKVRIPNFQTLLSILLLAVLAYLAFDTFGSRSGNRLFERYFEPFDNIIARYEEPTSEERDMAQILRYYDRRDYRSAYDELLPVAQAYPGAPLYLGVSALALGDPARASEWFGQLLPGDPFYQPAQWYEALAYLAMNRRPAAISLLGEITETPGHPFRRRAGELLGELVD